MTGEPKRVRTLFRQMCQQPWYRFPEEGRMIDATTEKGVYVIKHGQDVPHVGSTPRAQKGIRQRLGDRRAGRSSFVRKWFYGNSKHLRDSSYQYIVVDNSRERVLLEHYALGTLCPLHVG